MIEMTQRTEAQTPGVFGHLWKSMLGWGILSVLLGIAVLAWPGISLNVAAIFFGAYLLVSGIAQVLFAFALNVSGGERVLLFISGALSLVLGVLALRHLGEGSAVLLLAIWIGIGFIFQGVSEAALAITHRGLPGRGWHLALGVLSIIAGLVVLGSPFSSIVVLAIVTGVWLVVIGIAQIIWSLQARRVAKSAEKGLENLAGAADKVRQ